MAQPALVLKCAAAVAAIAAVAGTVSSDPFEL